MEDSEHCGAFETEKAFKAKHFERKGGIYSSSNHLLEESYL